MKYGLNFYSIKKDEFHKTLESSPLYKGKSLVDLKDVIIIWQAEERVVKYLFSNPKQ